MGLDMPAKLLPVLEEAAVTPVFNGLRQRCLHRRIRLPITRNEFCDWPLGKVR
jgi:hypothetical protein